MKRLRSSDDLDSFGEKSVFKDWGRRDDEPSLSRSSSHRSFYKLENGRKGVSSSFSSRYDRVEDERESSRYVRKRSDYEEGYDRRVGHDRYREGSERGILSSSPRSGYSGDRIHRSESFSRSPRREIPKGFRSERDRPRREASVSSWQRFGAGKDIDNSTLGGNQVGLEEKGNMRFSQKMREAKSPPCSKDSGSEQSKSSKKKDSESEQSKSTKFKDSESEQLKSTKMKDLVSVQSKSTKMKDLESEQSKGTKIKDSESEQLKCTKMKDLVSEQSKSTKMKDLESDQSKSAYMEDLGSDQSKNTKMKDLGSEQSKNTKMKDLRSGQWKNIKMKDLGSDQSNFKKMKDLGSNQSRSTISKDSGNEQLMSTKVMKIEHFGVESGFSSEMEEGELEPEPVPREKSDELADSKLAKEAELVSSLAVCKKVVSQEAREEEMKSLPELTSDIDGVCEENLKFESQKSVEEPVKAPDAFKTTEVIVGSKEEKKDAPIEELMPMKKKQEEGNFENHVIEVKDTVFSETKDVCEGIEVPEVVLRERVFGISPSFRDKGKNVVTSPSREDEPEVLRESNHLLNFEADEIEGPSTRGLDLFMNHPVKQTEKQHFSGFGKPKDERLELEPFDLSLSLPNVLLPIDCHNRGSAPSSPSHARSFQSIPSTFRTNSDGFTMSMSFTGSQSFRHNASCSLTNNPLDQFEHSVSSRPLFGGVDKVSASIWQGQASTEQTQKKIPMLQKALSNGDGFPIRDQQVKVAEGSSVPSGLNKELSLHSRQSSGSHENRSEYCNEKNQGMRGKVSNNLYEGNNRNEEQLSRGGADSFEHIITMIVSEPVHVMTKKFNEMTEQAIITLKEGVRDIVVNTGKRWQLSLFQKALVNRSELTLEMLLKANRAQLEILVALKTGVGEFLMRNLNISSSDMAEIYLNLRCRNLTCRNLLPVDECDCKVCSQKNGFCSNCMCLVCSKYDMASNTCSWVGCDVCLHWCHADCALRESYIRNGRISYGTHEVKEMQFHCIACDHPSEMFGFVKEVFQTFAKEWTAEKLSNELEYVKKIFSVSEDMRGKRLHDIALLMLSRLANKFDFREVQNQIMSFLAENGSIESNDPAVRSGKDLFNTNHEVNNTISDTWLKPLHSEKTPQLAKSSSFKSYANNNGSSDHNLQRRTPKEHVFDELDSIIRIKVAEAEMFQTRADDARREAEGLKRIAAAKNQKIEEEYASRFTKLRLLEAEEKRKRKIEELQGLERAHREYFSMKMRMEADIRDLLSKMEATKRNLAM